MDLATMQGACYLGNGRCRFRLWAPKVEQVELHLLSPQERLLPLDKRKKGYFQAEVEGVYPGQRYLYRLDGHLERPDPASRFQPEGVHGPSEVFNPDFDWSDACWHGLPMASQVLYELHVGLFTPEGTFQAVIPHLDALKDLGVTTLQLMPVGQFPGERNWGYDGVYPFAVQNSYGGPDGLRTLINAAHARQMAVLIDVVYNHLGPEGNYLHDFAPYFTKRYETPWGDAVNLDGPDSDEVRRYFISNALSWIEDYHADGLRLDATHAIIDMSAIHFLEELHEHVALAAERADRQVHVFAESDRNDVRLILPRELGGYGLDAQWNDDFQHALFTMLPGAEAAAYLNDYGKMEHLFKSYEEGYVYSGQYSPYRKRHHGNSSRHAPARRFVVFVQNHDQIGNRVKGDRLCAQVSFESLKLAAGAYLLSPYIPLLFMGEEYAEPAPFQYFVNHSEPELVEAVRKGRAEEFAHFFLDQTPPDPQDEATFLRSKLNFALRREGKHKVLWEFYRELLALRKKLPPLSLLSKRHMRVTGFARQKALFLLRDFDDQQVGVLLNFDDTPVELLLSLPRGRWLRRLDSSEARWLGEGSLLPAQLHSEGEVCVTLAPTCVALLEKEISD